VLISFMTMVRNTLHKRLVIGKYKEVADSSVNVSFM